MYFLNSNSRRQTSSPARAGVWTQVAWLCCSAIFAVSAGAQTAPAPEDVSPEAAALARRLEFEALEVNWTGGLREHVLVVVGRFQGVENPLRYAQRMRRDGGGWVVEAEVELPPSRIDDLSLLAAAFPAMADWSGSGRVGLTASLDRGDHGWGGAGTLTILDARLDRQEGGFGVDGLNGTVQWEWREGIFSTPPGQVLTFSSIGWDDVEAGAGEVELQVVGPEEVRVELAVVHWAGGRLSTGGFAINPAAPDVAIRLHADGIRLERLLELVPDLQAEGEGTIDGQLGLRIRGETVRLEPGQLSLRPGAAARLHLPSRAWFTEDMSRRDPSYENLRMVERALQDLSLSRFRLDFLPAEEGEPELRLEISGQPASRDLPAAPINLTVNVHGPIQDIGNWLLHPRVRMGIR